MVTLGARLSEGMSVASHCEIVLVLRRVPNNSLIGCNKVGQAKLLRRSLVLPLL